MLPLPGRVPGDDGWLNNIAPRHSRGRNSKQAYRPLVLSLEKDVFVVQATAPLVNWPDQLLLARRWVNDRPVEPKIVQEVEREQLHCQPAPTKRFEIAARLPTGLGELKQDDKIGLQLLYSTANTELLPATRNEAQLMKAMVELENRTPARIEFEVTPKLLANRPKRSSQDVALRLTPTDEVNELLHQP